MQTVFHWFVSQFLSLLDSWNNLRFLMVRNMGHWILSCVIGALIIFDVISVRKRNSLLFSIKCLFKLYRPGTGFVCLAIRQWKLLYFSLFRDFLTIMKCLLSRISFFNIVFCQNGDVYYSDLNYVRVSINLHLWLTYTIYPQNHAVKLLKPHSYQLGSEAYKEGAGVTYERYD